MSKKKNVIINNYLIIWIFQLKFDKQIVQFIQYYDLLSKKLKLTQISSKF